MVYYVELPKRFAILVDGEDVYLNKLIYFNENKFPLVTTINTKLSSIK